LLIGLRMGIDRAFPLIGFISGACQRVAIVKVMARSRDFRPNLSRKF
jgi:hypothetical protein